jgi:hypothetical protein
MSVQIAEPVLAYVEFLRAHIGDQVAQATQPDGAIYPAVFRPDLPRWFEPEMPTAAIVIAPKGGYTQFGKGQFPLADPRLEVVCYGDEDDQQGATQLARLVATVSKQLVSQVWNGVLLVSAAVSGGPMPLPDTQTTWPAAWLSVQLVHGEYPQPANDL